MTTPKFSANLGSPSCSNECEQLRILDNLSRPKSEVLKDLFSMSSSKRVLTHHAWNRLDAQHSASLCAAFRVALGGGQIESVPSMLLSLPQVLFSRDAVPRSTPYCTGIGSEGGAAGGMPPLPPHVPPGSSSQDPEVILTELLVQSYLSDVNSENCRGAELMERIGDDENLEEVLESRGMSHLAESLDSPFLANSTEIAALRVPLVMEAIVSLQEVCEIQSPADRTLSNRLVQFALELARGVLEESAALDAEDRAECASRLQSILGRLLYLANQDYASIAAVIDCGQRRASITRIAQLFKASLDQQMQRLTLLKQAHEKTGMQSAQQALNEELPKFFAHALLCRDGMVNIGVVEDLRVQFLGVLSADSQLGYHFDYALRKLQGSAGLRAQLSQIQAPNSAHSSAGALIRIALGLASDAPITDVHAREVVLAGILAYMRQGDSRACFASALAVLLHNSAQSLFVQDASALLREGAIQRTVSGQVHDFPLYLRVGRGSPGRLFKLDPQGRVVGVSGIGMPFWEAPGFQAVCHYFGLENPSERGERVYREDLCSSTQDLHSPQSIRFLQVTEEDILKGLVQQLVAERGGNAAQLLHEAFFVWEALVANPLLRVWESSIAAMAETSENSINRKMVIESISFALDRKLRPACKSNPELKREFELRISSVLERRVRLVFDPSVPGEGGLDGHSSQGGFRLCNDDVLIADPSSFQNFIECILGDLQRALQKNILVDDLEVNKVLSQLISYVHSDDFVLQAIRRCAFHRLKNPLRDYERLQFAPWCIKAGANFKDVLATYFGVSKRPQFQWAFCPRATDLLHVVLDLMKKHQPWIKKSQHPRKLLPARAQGMHVFSLMLDDPSMTQLLRENDLDNWIEEHILDPGRRISHALLSHQTRLHMLSHCFAPLLQKLEAELGTPVSVANRSTFYRDLIDLDGQVSLKAYRDGLMGVLKAHVELPMNEDVVATVEILLDEELIRGLPRDTRKQLQGAALRFGDTHWLHRNSLRDIYFCFVYNPGSCQVELAKILDDNSEVQLLSQKEWLQERNWEFCSAMEEDADT